MNQDFNEVKPGLNLNLKVKASEIEKARRREWEENQGDDEGGDEEDRTNEHERKQQQIRNKTYRRRTKTTNTRKSGRIPHLYDSPRKRCSGGDAGADLDNSEHPILVDVEDEGEGQIRDNITVIVRIRPRKKCEKVAVAKTVVKVVDDQTLLFDPKVNREEFYFHGIKQKFHDCSRRPNKNINFIFDGVYGPKSTNVEIFETSLKPIVGHIIRGYSCSIFAYGATGSGKTFTMLGNTANPGLSFLMAMELYKRIGEIGKEYDSEVVVSYLEVYNETLKDLLHPSESLLSIRENGLNGVSIPNLTKHKPKDASAMLRLLSYGNNHRTQHPTDHNSESSRSHAIFEVGVSLRKKFTHLAVKYKMTKAKLVMIDLAGSERGSSGVAAASGTASSNAQGARTREGSNINKSLLALGNCINALADGKKHVPYRDSKLTRILKDSLGGNSKTVMIANISPTSLNYDDTYNSLKYADRAKQIKITCKKNVLAIERDPESGHGHTECHKIIQDLQAEIIQLKSLVMPQQDQQAPDAVSTEPSPILTPFVPDPAAAVIEQFIQLLSTKKRNEETHVEAALKAKEAEWALRWREWRIEAIKALGTGRSSQEQTHLLKTSLQRLKQEMVAHAQTQSLCEEQVQLAKQVLDYNEKELDHLRQNGLSSLKLEDPFLGVTLSEFLYFKSLEREVSTHKCMENHHQALCSTLLNEVLQGQTLLTMTLRFLQTIWRFVKENGLNPSEKCQKKYLEILQTAYGHTKVNIPPNNSTAPAATATPNLSTSSSTEKLSVGHKRKKKQLTDSVQALHKVLTNPTLDYEPPPTTASTIQPERERGLSVTVKMTNSFSSLASTCSFTEVSSSGNGNENEIDVEEPGQRQN